jgi:hypothetical protein
MTAPSQAQRVKDAFFVEPYSTRELCIHITGAVANAALCLSAIFWMASTWSSHPVAWWGVVSAVLVGIYCADLLSGILHWAFDTWFNEHIVFVRRMVLQVREHHVHPGRIFDIHFTHDAGTLSWIALLVTAPVLGVAIFIAGAQSALAVYAIIASSVFSVILVFMLETHKCGHRTRNPRWVHWLQRSGLLLSVSHHGRHHRGSRDINYCIVNGWADRTLGRLGLFRLLERTVTRLTGAVPRLNDHEWLRRFPRTTVTRAR